MLASVDCLFDSFWGFLLFISRWVKLAFFPCSSPPNMRNNRSSPNIWAQCFILHPFVMLTSCRNASCTTKKVIPQCRNIVSVSSPWALPLGPCVSQSPLSFLPWSSWSHAYLCVNGTGFDERKALISFCVGGFTALCLCCFTKGKSKWGK